MAKRKRTIPGKSYKRDIGANWAAIQELLARLVERDVLTEGELREIFSRALRQLEAEAGATRDETVLAAITKLNNAMRRQ